MAITLPWKLWNGYGPLPNSKYAVARIGPEGGMFDGLVGSEGHDIIGTKEMLEYVVKAVNSHEKLLEAAKAALDAINALEARNGIRLDTAEQLRAAIKAAEKERKV